MFIILLLFSESMLNKPIRILVFTGYISILNPCFYPQWWFFGLYCSSSMKTKLTSLGNPNIFPSLTIKMRLWCNYYSGPSMKKKAEYISFLWVSFCMICLNAVVILGLQGNGFWKHVDSLLPKLSLEMLRMVETKPCMAGFSTYRPNFLLLVEIIGKCNLRIEGLENRTK